MRESQHPPGPSQPIVRRKLPDEVLDRLLAMIERREIEPGGKMPSERDLMARFGVGRPAVREAMQSLARMGLVQIAHGERARLLAVEPKTVFEQIDQTVRHLLTASPETREHLQEARLLFECGMARLAARRASVMERAKLKEVLTEEEEAQGDAALFVERDIAFHAAIAGCSGNPIFAAVSEAMLSWVFSSYPRLLRVPGTEKLTLAEHRAILNAIEAGDEERAALEMTAHLNRANPLYRKQVRRAKRA